MIDVDTYRMLPKPDQREIDLWLDAWLYPHHNRCTEIEMIDESGSCRVRLQLIRDGGPVVDGDEFVMTDRIVNGQPTPEVVRAFGPGSEPPSASFVLRRHR